MGGKMYAYEGTELAVRLMKRTEEKPLQDLVIMDAYILKQMLYWAFEPRYDDGMAETKRKMIQRAYDNGVKTKYEWQQGLEAETRKQRRYFLYGGKASENKPLERTNERAVYRF